ncbi:LuxR C-terminal-related transcriptional regulator [Micromonospora echinospora]|uniref:helix-turn-helix transcriptional regulator n=1 Tax=Micromonospora echinospora TaxID=1877 RepID=UPI003A83F68E
MLRGRDEERRAIRDLLDGAGGGALLLQGEPGSGRTALVGYAHRHAADRTILAGAGLTDEAALPYAGLQRLLDPVRDRAGALPVAQRRVLRRALAGAGCPAGQRLTLSMAVLGLLAVAARERPLLCTMDDVDLGDRPTAAALAFVARRLRHLPVVVLLTGAVDTAPGGIPARRLRPLDGHDSRAVLADRLPVPAADPVVTTLGAVAAGNPQALVDLAESLTPAQCRGEEDLPTTPPPDGALGRDHRARLDRLPDDARHLLLLAALDPELDAATLVRAARATGTAIEALVPAEVAGLVRVEAHGVTFPRPLVRAMVVATAPLAARRAAHLVLAALLDDGDHRLRRALHLAAAAEDRDPALATELEAAARDDGDPDTRSTALHRAAELSVDPARAAARLVAAAHHAWSAGRPHRARLLTRHLPTGLPAVTGRVELLRGEMELRCGRTPVALAALLAAADACAGTAPDLALAALLRAGEAVCFAGDQYRYADVARRARTLGRAGSPPGTELLTAQLAGVAATLRGDHEAAGPTLRRAVVLGDRLTGPDLTPAALTGAAVAALLVAEDGPAHRLADRAVALARVRGGLRPAPGAGAAGGRRVLAGPARGGGGDLPGGAARGPGHRPDHLGRSPPGPVGGSGRRPRRPGGQSAADPGARRGTGTGQPPRRPGPLGPRGARPARRATRGRRRPARGPGLPRHRTRTGHGAGDGHAVPGGGRRRVGAPAGGRRGARRLRPLGPQHGQPVPPGPLRAVSRAARPRGSQAAEEGYRAALRWHPPGAGAFERARTEFLFGRELRRSRRPRDARRYLHDARETFTRLGVAAWAEQAAAELRAAGESVGGPDRSAAQLLTGQQLRVAQLVAEGATNREVADRMFLSTRTVDHHLRNIFHRLGIRSRTQLARVL